MNESRTISLPVQGMTCAACATRVERVLRRTQGVLEVQVNLATERARIVYESGRVGVGKLRQVIEEAGYALPVETRSLPIQGMTCAACVGRVERALRQVPGVLQVEVNLASERATVEGVAGVVEWESIPRQLEAVGYASWPVELTGDPGEQRDREQRAREQDIADLRRRLGICAGLSGIVFLGSMIPHLPGWGALAPSVRHLLLLFLTAPVQFWGGARFHRKAWKAVRHGSADMNVLISVGTFAAFFYSLMATVAPRFLQGDAHVYFDTSAMIITLVLLGRWLEARARGRASAAIRALVALAPQRAHRLRDGREEEVAVEKVQVGDRLRVKPGEQVPVDGVVLEGRSSVDEAMVTGESLPVEKSAGSEVIGGTLNRAGTFIMEAARVGRDTMLARIIRLVEEAQACKAPVQRLADRIAAVFVPTVIVIALATLALWLAAGAPLAFALSNFVAVLIIACPCALGLATPAAIMVATGRGAGLGVLVRNGEVLETVHRLTLVVMDKTGTLTQGRPRVTDLLAARGYETQVEDTLALAAGVERASEHPLAEAVLEEAQRRSLSIPEPESFEALVGRGARGCVAGHEVVVGSQRLMKEQAVALDGWQEEAERLAQEGKTALFVAVDGQLRQLLGIADVPRPEAQTALQWLHRLGLRVVLLTGDREQAARAIAARLGVDQVRADVLPEQKSEEVARLQAAGEVVGMVGDGINDAPALAQADVGFALGSGTDVAVETGGIVLVRNDLTTVPLAIELSRFALRIIRQNLFWAFFYNCLGIPLAAGLFYPWFGIRLHPMIAGAAMAFSSVSVLTNSLRLQGWQPTPPSTR